MNLIPFSFCFLNLLINVNGSYLSGNYMAYVIITITCNLECHSCQGLDCKSNVHVPMKIHLPVAAKSEQK